MLGISLSLLFLYSTILHSAFALSTSCLPACRNQLIPFLSVPFLPIIPSHPLQTILLYGLLLLSHIPIPTSSIPITSKHNKLDACSTKDGEPVVAKVFVVPDGINVDSYVSSLAELRPKLLKCTNCLPYSRYSHPFTSLSPSILLSTPY